MAPVAAQIRLVSVLGLYAHNKGDSAMPIPAARAVGRYLWPVPPAGTCGRYPRPVPPAGACGRPPRTHSLGVRGPSAPVGEGHVVVLYYPLLSFIYDIMATLWGYLKQSGVRRDESNALVYSWGCSHAGAGRSHPSHRPGSLRGHRNGVARRGGTRSTYTAGGRNGRWWGYALGPRRPSTRGSCVARRTSRAKCMVAQWACSEYIFSECILHSLVSQSRMSACIAADD